MEKDIISINQQITTIASGLVIFFILFASAVSVLKKKYQEQLRRTNGFVMVIKRTFLISFFLLFTFSMALMMILKVEHPKSAELPRIMAGYWNVLMLASISMACLLPLILLCIKHFINKSLFPFLDFKERFENHSYLSLQEAKKILVNVLKNGGHALLITDPGNVKQASLADFINGLSFDAVESDKEYDPSDAPIVATSMFNLNKTNFFAPEVVFILKTELAGAQMKQLEGSYSDTPIYILK